MAVVCFSKSLVPLGKSPNILGSSFIPNQANHQQIDTSPIRAVNGNVKICELSKLSFTHAWRIGNQIFQVSVAVGIKSLNLLRRLSNVMGNRAVAKVSSFTCLIGGAG